MNKICFCIVQLLCIFFTLDISASKVDSYLDSAHQLSGIERYQYFCHHLSDINDFYVDTILYFAEQAEEDPIYQKSIQLQGLVALLKANHAVVQSNYSIGIPYAEEAIAKLSRSNDTTNLARAYNEMGAIYSYLAQFDKAAESFNQSVELIDKVQEPKLYYSYRINSLSILKVFNEEEALKQYKLLLQECKLNYPAFLPKVYYALVLIYSDMVQKDSLNKYSDLAIKYSKSLGDSIGLSSTYSSLAYYYNRLEEGKIALHYAQKALRLSQKTAFRNQEVNALFTLSAAYTNLKQTEKALNAINRADSIIQQHHLNSHEELVAFERSKLYAKQADFQQAYFYLDQFLSLYDEKRKAEHAQQINSLQEQFKAKERSLEIEKLKGEKKAEKLRSSRLYIGLLALFILSFSSTYYLVQKRKKDKVIARQKNDILKLELKERQREKVQMKKDLQNKGKLLVEKSMQLSEKSQFIDELQAELKPLEKKVGSDENIRNIRQKLKLNQKSEKEWKEFQGYFDQLHPNFFEELQTESNQKLSKAEKRLAALIALDMDNKACAALLHIASSSVKMAKYRLKKKLNLESSASLDHYIKAKVSKA
tara:strand:+ start:2492 stop:4270 length:1779 start_codon:yes stop_codon:yes gene_type:complete